MTHEEALTTLQKLGTAQNIKTYRRHGAGKNVYGVSFANLKVLVKKIKADHALAKSLLQTGNCDARTLALMIADPSLLTVSEAEAWLKEANYKLLVDYIAASMVHDRVTFFNSQHAVVFINGLMRKYGHDDFVKVSSELYKHHMRERNSGLIEADRFVPYERGTA